MPVRKYRSVEDVPPPPRASTPSDGVAGACATSAIAAALGPSARAPRGVRRFRSIEDADAHRRSWELPAARTPSAS